MELSRYDFIDAYVLEELRREYQSSDISGRIGVLQRFYDKGLSAPFEIALLAVEDPNVEIRQWIAHHGVGLDYREMVVRSRKNDDRSDATQGAEDEDDFETTYKYPDRNLVERLKHDPDPFVRACLRENPDAFQRFFTDLAVWEQHFREATHLERLALVRNPNVYHEFMERIFDPHDKELAIDMEQRSELARAFLTNRVMLEEEGKDAGLSGHPWPSDGWAWHSANKFLNTLWEYASKWPVKSGIPASVFRYVPAEDKTKAQIYGKCEKVLLRQLILENCGPGDSDAIELGMKDSDETCRLLAYSKVRYLRPEQIETLLQGDDTSALSGLAKNEALSVETLEKVRERLNQLNDDIGWAWAFDTIKRIAKTKAPEDPDELFSYEGREGNFTEDKIDFIGNKLVLLERWLREELAGGTKSIQRRLDSVDSRVSIALGLAFLALLLWFLK
jgi:hypothetical protein